MGELRVQLIDGTYELFRHHFGQPSRLAADGSEIAATRGVLTTVLMSLERGATHIGVATDHVIESFRNALWPGYKTSAGVPDALLAQFPVLELCLEAMGVTVWPMTDLEADDALASAAAVAADDPRVATVQIMTPDKDLAQCVRGNRVVQVDRSSGAVSPDGLPLVGGAADGSPGVWGGGKRSPAQVLAGYGTFDAIPAGVADR